MILEERERSKDRKVQVKEERRESEEEHVEEKHEMPESAVSPSEDEESEDTDSDSGSGESVLVVTPKLEKRFELVIPDQMSIGTTRTKQPGPCFRTIWTKLLLRLCF